MDTRPASHASTTAPYLCSPTSAQSDHNPAMLHVQRRSGEAQHAHGISDDLYDRGTRQLPPPGDHPHLWHTRDSAAPARMPPNTDNTQL